MATTRSRSTTTRKPRTTRTKAELATDFEELESQASSADALDPQAEVLASQRAEQVRGIVKGLSVDTIVQDGAQFSLRVGRTISQLTEEAVETQKRLDALKEAVKLEEETLQKLYNLDVAAASVQQLIEEHKTKKAAFEKEMETVREQWEEDQAAYAKSERQRIADIETARRREQADYDYRVRQERLKVEDEFAQKQLKAERELADRVAMVEKTLSERQAIITKEQAEWEQQKARLATIDQEVEQRSKRDVAIATSALKKDLENAFALERKDLQQQLALSEQKNAALTDASARLAVQVEVLTKQLEAAKSQVTEVTVKALEASSGQLALQNVRDIVKENGSGAKGGKA